MEHGKTTSVLPSQTPQSIFVGTNANVARFLQVLNVHHSRIWFHTFENQGINLCS